MSGKICPLMSRVNPGNWTQGAHRFIVDEVVCYEERCQMWDAQTGTCGLVTGGILAGRAAVTAEMRGDRGE